MQLSSAQSEHWLDWNIVRFGSLLFIFNNWVVVQFEVNCPDDELRGMFMLGEKGGIPTEFRPDMWGIERPGVCFASLIKPSPLSFLSSYRCALAFQP